MNTYTLGTDVKITGVFNNLAGAVFDPTTVTIIVREPDGIETSYLYGTDAEAVKASTGTYYIWIATDQSGRYSVRFKGGGTVKVAKESKFEVSVTAFTTP